MRKFLAVAAVVVLAVAVAVPAMALDFKFGGEYRVRFYNYANAGFTEDPGSNPRGAQVRVRPRFDASDDNGNITAVLRLEIGDIEFGNGGGASGGGAAGGYGLSNNIGVAQSGSRVGNGSGGATGNDGINVETKWAYIDAALPPSACPCACARASSPGTCPRASSWMTTWRACASTARRSR